MLTFSSGSAKPKKLSGTTSGSTLTSGNTYGSSTGRPKKLGSTTVPTQLPLSSSFEAGRRGLDDAFSGQQASINAQMQQIDPATALQQGRISTYRGRALQGVNDDFSGRGIFRSGFRNTARGQTNYNYDTQMNDATLAAGQQKAALTQQLAQAAQDHSSGLYDLLLQVAQDQQQQGVNLDANGNLPYLSKGVF